MPADGMDISIIDMDREQRRRIWRGYTLLDGEGYGAVGMGDISSE